MRPEGRPPAMAFFRGATADCGLAPWKLNRTLLERRVGLDCLRFTWNTEGSLERR